MTESLLENYQTVKGHPHPIAQAAAKWWANCMRVPQDYGNEQLASLADATIQNFQDALAAGIEWYMGQTIGCLQLEVDYGADFLLARAAKHVGIPSLLGRLPAKTIMRVYADRVYVKMGDGQAYKEIFHI